MRMNVKRLLLIFSIVAASLITGPAAMAEPEWKLRQSEDGISVYTRKVDGSSVKAFKGTVELDAQLASALALLNDQDACEKWVHGCVSSELLKQLSFEEGFIYQVNKPPAIRSRDYIFHVIVDITASLDRAEIRLTSRSDYLPETSHVRIKRATGTYTIETISPGKIRLTWEQHLEPGGFVPGFIINAMLLDIPHRSLRNFRELLKHDKYQQMEFVFSEQGEVLGIGAPHAL